MEPYNHTHIGYTELLFKLTSPTTEDNTPRAFVLTSQREGTYILFAYLRGLICLMDIQYAQDLFTTARQKILDLRLQKTPRHALNYLRNILDLHRWLTSEKMKIINYSELLSTLMLYTGYECIGLYPNSTTICSIGTVVFKWDQLMLNMTSKGTILFTTRTCCHETSSCVICVCNTLQPFSYKDTRLISVQSLHGYSDAVQVSHTQWCVVSEMISFSYGGLTYPANHTFSMGQLNILGRTALEFDVSLVGRHILRARNPHPGRDNELGTTDDSEKKMVGLGVDVSSASAFIYTFLLVQCCYFHSVLRISSSSPTAT
uniref:Uncharacterized protein n=1 Tax=Denticeps clupeoides TaxID=299321 RepID=A0AAY4A5K5_9TELE